MVPHLDLPIPGPCLRRPLWEIEAFTGPGEPDSNPLGPDWGEVGRIQNLELLVLKGLRQKAQEGKKTDRKPKENDQNPENPQSLQSEPLSNPVLAA